MRILYSIFNILFDRIDLKTYLSKAAFFSFNPVIWKLRCILEELNSLGPVKDSWQPVKSKKKKVFTYRFFETTDCWILWVQQLLHFVFSCDIESDGFFSNVNWTESRSYRWSKQGESERISRVWKMMINFSKKNIFRIFF